MNKETLHKLTIPIEIGLISLALSGCVSTLPKNAGGYYTPFTDEIHMKEGFENDKRLLVHEQTHQKRANETGRIVWGIEYTLSPTFRCEEEVIANLEAGIEPAWNHPACTGLKPGEIITIMAKERIIYNSEGSDTATTD